MRIGLISGEFPPMQGGIADFTASLAHALSAQGHTVCVFSQQAARQQTPDVPLYQHAQGWGWRSVLALRQWIAAHKLDLVNMHFQTAAYDMSPLVHFYPQLLRVPFVTTFHDLRFPYLFPKAGRLRDWIVMHLARHSRGVITTNSADYARVQHLAHSAMIPLASSIPAHLPPTYDREAWRRKVGADDATYLLAHFGFVNHSKGIDHLLRAIAHLRADSIPVRLLMIGGRTGASDATNATYADTIDRQIADLALADSITWTGYASNDDVTAYLNASDVVTLPFRDGASYRRSSLTTAIQHACCIVTTCPAQPQPHFAADNLYMVTPDDSDALAEALRELYQHPARRDAFRRGANTLRQHFSWEGVAVQTLQLFKEVIADDT